MPSRILLAAALLAASSSCRMEEPSKEVAKDSTPSAVTAAPAAAPAKKPPARSAEPIGARGVKFIKAEDGDVATLVKKHLDEAKAQNRDVLVYEGATWCEPCRSFHAAAAKGELDARFPNLTLIEFDADHDGERLVVAGYTSRFIPLFAVPNADGASSGKIVEGSIKGVNAADEIAPRLLALLGR